MVTYEGRRLRRRGARRLQADAARYGTPEEIQGIKPEETPSVVKVTLVRQSAGCYTTPDGACVVQKNGTDWYWFSQDGKHGGEVRATKSEAVLDLIDFLQVTL